MNDYQLLPVESAQIYTADFTDVLPSAVTLTACVWTVSPSITLGSQTDDLPNARSSIKASGGAHGVTYNLQAKGTLSNGETITKDICLMGFNG